MIIIRNINPEDVKTYWTLEAMRKFGGGFVKLIGNLGAHADEDNILRMKKAWPEYWERYEKMGQSLQTKKEQKDGS